MSLKVQGVLECGELLIAALLCDGRATYIRAAHVAANGPGLRRARFKTCGWRRAPEGIGMGWVSLFDPQALAAPLLDMPEGSLPVAILFFVRWVTSKRSIPRRCWRSPAGPKARPLQRAAVRRPLEQPPAAHEPHDDLGAAAAASCLLEQRLWHRALRRPETSDPRRTHLHYPRRSAPPSTSDRGVLKVKLCEPEGRAASARLRARCRS